MSDSKAVLTGAGTPPGADGRQRAKDAHCFFFHPQHGAPRPSDGMRRVFNSNRFRAPLVGLRGWHDELERLRSVSQSLDREEAKKYVQDLAATMNELKTAAADDWTHSVALVTMMAVEKHTKENFDSAHWAAWGVADDDNQGEKLAAYLDRMYTARAGSGATAAEPLAFFWLVREIVRHVPGALANASEKVKVFGARVQHLESQTPGGTGSQVGSGDDLLAVADAFARTGQGSLPAEPPHVAGRMPMTIHQRVCKWFGGDFVHWNRRGIFAALIVVLAVLAGVAGAIAWYQGNRAIERFDREWTPTQMRE